MVIQLHPASPGITGKWVLGDYTGAQLYTSNLVFVLVLEYPFLTGLSDLSYCAGTI